MAKEIKIAVEGPGADRALADFLSMEDLDGHPDPVDDSEARRDPVTLLAVGTIVGIASAAITITDKILAWRDQLKKQAETRRMSVVIEDAKGNRLSLESATPEQITAALQTLTPPAP